MQCQARVISACNVEHHCKHRLIGRVAGPKWWVTAWLCELQKPIGVITMAGKGNFSLQCRVALLHTACKGSLGMVAGHMCGVTAGLYELQKPMGVLQCQARLISACIAEQHCCIQHAKAHWAWLLSISGVLLHGCVCCKNP